MRASTTIIPLLALFFGIARAVPDFRKCLAHLKDQAAANTPVNATGDNTSAILFEWGLRASDGKAPANPYDAVAIDYRVCVNVCGSTPKAFNWSSFSQGFSSWLLPWLALVSQLPFGSRSRLDNLISVFLTVGSPTLAAYSLGLTVINSRWVHRKFDGIKFQNSRTAALILDRFQQIPLQINSNNGLMVSLVSLPENDPWWNGLLERLNNRHNWSIATATGITWVAVAYAFTLVDSFMGLGQNLGGSGQAVGSLWLWLLPLVTGWLLVPVSGRHKLAKALNRANDIAYVECIQASPDNPKQSILLNLISDERAITLSDRAGEVYTHEWKSDPIFNYSRVWGWVSVVEEVAEAFEMASKSARKRQTKRENSEKPDHSHADETRPANVDSCYNTRSPGRVTRRRWGEGAFSRVFVASMLALGLQWATTISAVVVVYFTPTTGLGCRSAAYLLYGILSTIIWAMLVVSSMLSHHHSESTRAHPPSYPCPKRPSIPALLSVFLRRASVVLAAINSVLVVATCTFHISGVLSNCYCGSSVLGRSSKHAFLTAIGRDGHVLDKMRGAWSGNVILGGSFTALFVGFVYLMTDNSNDFHYYQ